MEVKSWWQRLCGVKYGPWLLLLTVLLAFLSLMAGETAQVGSATGLEQRLGRVLSQIEGAGQVEVALYYEGEQRTSLWEEQSVQTPVGAVIVARGGADIGVRMHLTRAAATLLGLPQTKICVFPMEEGS